MRISGNGDFFHHHHIFVLPSSLTTLSRGSRGASATPGKGNEGVQQNRVWTWDGEQHPAPGKLLNVPEDGKSTLECMRILKPGLQHHFGGHNEPAGPYGWRLSFYSSKSPASIATHSQLVFPDLPWKAYRLRSASGKLSSWVQSTSFFDRQLGDQLPGRVRLAQRGRPSSPLLHQPLRLRLTHTQARCNLDLELLETYNTLSFQFPRFCSTLVMPPSRSGKHPTIEREVKKLGVALTKRCDALSHALR